MPDPTAPDAPSRQEDVMRWKGRRQSENIEVRGPSLPRTMALGGGIGGIVILLLLVLLGADPQQLLQQVGNDPAVNVGDPGADGVLSPEQRELSEFVAVVLADTEDVWGQLFSETGRAYREPTLVRFSGTVESACGFASAASGPFYCPADEKVYLDLEFFQELKERLGAPGDFAQAYVIAHEIGHHVQKQLGITDRVHGMRSQLSEADYNQLSVRLELQADFFAGVWAHHAQQNWNILEPGDIEEALNAAGAIGDDRLQREARGYFRPETFTHGTSAQRVRWFRRGLATGDMSQGDTFNADEL
jgi:predicted metalloprotease